MRSSTRHHEQRYRQKLAEARATLCDEDAANPPAASDSEPTAESLGLVAARSTQGCTPKEPHGDRPTWYRAPCTDSATLSEQRCDGNRTTTVCCTTSRPSPARTPRVGSLAVFLSWCHGWGAASLMRARRELSDFGRTHRPEARAGVGRCGCRRRRGALCAYKRPSAWAAADLRFLCCRRPTKAWPGFLRCPGRKPCSTSGLGLRAGWCSGKGERLVDALAGGRRRGLLIEPPRRHLPSLEPRDG